jgi:hypothetical protein
MKNKNIVLALVVVAAAVMLASRNKAQAATVRPNGYTGTSSGVTIDPQGRWWFGGQIIYAPVSEWQT